jgi:hypothetical protein
MSYYFRPANSREQNLFIIRTSIDNLTVYNFTNKILNNTAFSSPSYVFLPAGLSLAYNNDSYLIFTLDYTNAKYEIPPTVNIQIKDDLINANNIGPWFTSIVNTTPTQVTFYIYKLKIENGNIVPLYPLMYYPSDDELINVGIQIQIVGRTLTGPTFAIANQGWTYVESTNPSSDTIYSAMPVGTNGVIPSYDFTIGGTYGYLGGAGNGGIPNGTSLQNYTPDEVMANINNYYFFPIVLGANNDSITMPTTTNIGQEVVLLLNQNANNVLLTIDTENTTLETDLVMQNEGDMVKFVSLNKDGVGIRWVKINSL